MELQLALLLIGCIIIGVVALTTYERVRFSRRRLTADSGAAEAPAVITRARQAALSTGLDINPGPPHDSVERQLTSINGVLTLVDGEEFCWVPGHPIKM